MRLPFTFTAGIDEAGRGCVIGPLVVAIVAASPKDLRWFRSQNVRDSKKVPPRERETLAAAIRERCWHQLFICPPAAIDDAVRDRSRTLNGLECERMAEGITAFMQRVPPAEATVTVDAPSVNATAIHRILIAKSGWPHPERLIAEHRADENHLAVAAASIIAKFERERLLDILKQELDEDLGCGYPHDPKTIAHLRTVPVGAPHVRWTWTTAQKAKNPILT